MKILSKCKLIKLREYKKSYGGIETISPAYILDKGREIHILDNFGKHSRTMKVGTKLLISFSGEEITERQLKLRTKKAIKIRDENRAKQTIIDQENQDVINAIAASQAIQWAEFLIKNPESKAKYLAKMGIMPSKKWRNYLRMKAAKHINNENFTSLEISAPRLRQILLLV